MDGETAAGRFWGDPTSAGALFPVGGGECFPSIPSHSPPLQLVPTEAISLPRINQRTTGLVLASLHPPWLLPAFSFLSVRCKSTHRPAIILCCSDGIVSAFFPQSPEGDVAPRLLYRQHGTAK